MEPSWATPEILIFFRMRFSNFFLNYMVWKYQNEIAPIFYYGMSTKTNEKDIKIAKLQSPDWKSPYWMSLYIVGAVIYDFPKYVDIYYLSIWCNLPRNASDCWWHIEWRISVVDDTSNGHCLINSCILQLKVTIPCYCYYSSVNKASLDVTSRRIL